MIHSSNLLRQQASRACNERSRKPRGVCPRKEDEHEPLTCPCPTESKHDAKTVLGVGRIIFFTIHLTMLGVKDIDKLDRLGWIHPHGCNGRFSFLQSEAELRSLGHLGKLPSGADRTTIGSPPRKEACPDDLRAANKSPANPWLGFPERRFQIFDPAVKVIGRAEEKDRTSYFFQARRIAHRFQVEGGFRITVADSAAGRSRRLDALSEPAVRTVNFPPMECPYTPSLDPSTSGCLSKKVNPRRAPKAARNHELFRGDSTGSSVQSATGIEGNASLPFRLGA